MASLVWCVSLLLLATCGRQVNAKRGYLLTAPSRFIPGRAERVCIDIIDVNSNISVELALYRTTETAAAKPISVSAADMVQRVTFVIPAAETTGCVEMMLPAEDRLTTEYLALMVQGEQLPLQRLGYSFQGQTVIRVLDQLTPREVCFIQTDKTDYKPSQTVNIRVLRLDTKLKPINMPIASVSVRTPGGVTVERWSNVAVRSGLAVLKLHLADDLEMGEWSIVLNEGAKEEVKTFNVKQYELPGFELTVTPPGHALLTDDAVTAQICATRTYGKSVRGMLVGKICLRQPMMMANVNQDAFCQPIARQWITGCTNVVANRIRVGWDRRYNDWAKTQLVFHASVRENVTGTNVTAEETVVPFSGSSFVLKLEGSDVFKPGLPYHAMVTVTTANGKPSSARVVTIEVDNKSTGQVNAYTKTYTTDTRGVALVTIPAFIGHHLNITATMIILDEPTLTATLNPKAWYSPSGSFLQVVPLTAGNTLMCGARAKYTVQYTASQASNVTVIYKVVGVGGLAATFQQDVALATGNPLAGKDPAVVWDNSNWHTTLIQTNAAVAPRILDPNQPEFNPAKSISVATHKGSFTVSFPVTSDLSPQGSLVVYYVRADGEVVSDNFPLDVPECSQNTVRLTLSRDQVQPGQNVQLNVSASPGSVCNYGLTERNTFVHAKENYPTLATLIQSLKAYSLPTSRLSSYLPVNFHCRNLHGTPAEFAGFASYWELPSLYRGRDSSQGFVGSGLVVSSDLKVQTAPCKRIYYRTHDATANSAVLGGLSGPTATAAVPSRLDAPASASTTSVGGQASPEVVVLDSPPAVPSRDSPTQPAEGTLSAGPKPSLLRFVGDVSSFFPETALFDIIDVSAAGSSSVQLAVPDVITQWVGSAVCTDDQDGLGISTPVTLSAFHPYAVDVKLPSPTATSGEIIPVEVTVSNYLTACIAVDISLAASTNFVAIGEFLFASAPSICICGGAEAKKMYNIALREIGEDIPVSVTVSIINNRLVCPMGSIMSNTLGVSRTAVKPISVQPVGVPREYTYGDHICLDSSTPASSVYTKDFRLPRANSRARVPNSEIAEVLVVGNLLGHALFDASNLINAPSAGEPNVATFAPSSFILKYLDATRQTLTPPKREELLRNIKTGYQTQLTFAHPDGSYSQFGPNQKYQNAGDEPSLWLTAYVVKSLGQAKRYIHVDEKQLKQSVDYIISKQAPWGCFPVVGFLHNQAMQSAIDSSMGDNYALTAFVIIALMESGYGEVTRQVGGTQVHVVDSALDCMYVRSRRFRAMRDGYSLSLATYAFALHNRRDRRSRRAYTALHRQQSTKSDGHKYWRAMRVATRVRTGRHWFNRPLEINVESTSYGLLATLIMANSTYARHNGFHVTQWLSEERNYMGGFGTSQGTAVGMQALAEYALKFNSPVTANVSLNFVRTINRTRTVEEEVATFSLRADNRLTAQKAPLPRVRTLALSANGDGCFNFQVNVKYRIKNPDSTGQPFSTSVTVRNNTLMSQMCRRKPLLICTSYSKGKESGLTVMEIKMQTGWQVLEPLVEKLLQYPSIRVKKYEISGKDGSVKLYFTSLTMRRICFLVYARRVALVRNGQPAVISTYDYYKRDVRQETTYHITC